MKGKNYEYEILKANPKPETILRYPGNDQVLMHTWVRHTNKDGIKDFNHGEFVFYKAPPL